MIYNEKISVSISNKNYSSKEEVNYTSIKFYTTNVTIKELASTISEGYAITHNFFDYNKGYITTKDKTEYMFRYATYVALDLDNCEYNTLKELLSTLTIQPTISYTTLSHKLEGKGNRYRLIYVFNNLIYNPIEYCIIYDNLVNTILADNSTLVFDNSMRNVAQMCLGSSCYAPCAELITSDNTYDNEDYLTTRISTFLAEKKEIKNKTNFEKIEGEVKYTISNEEFINDFNTNLGNEELLSKYVDKYDWFESTPLNITDSTTPKIELPENYIEIKRYYNKVLNNVTGHHTITGVRKYRNGEGRRNKLFINAVLRRYMLPSITLDHLLYCLIKELCEYYINIPGKGNGYINRTMIKAIALSSFSIDLQGENVLKFINKNKKKSNWIVNPLYVAKNNTTKYYVRNQIKKEMNDNLISKYFDVNLSIKENLEIMKNNDVKISSRKLYSYRNELLGIQPKPRKEKVFKETKIEVEDMLFGSELTEESKKFIEEHTNKHISAPCAPTTKTTAKTTNDVEPQTEKIMKEENEVQINEAIKIRKEVSKQTNSYNKLNSMLIIDALKDYQLKFNKKISEEEVKEIFEVIENRCIRFVLAAIRTDYDDYKDKKQLINKYTNLVPNEYKEKITEYINELI